MLTIYPYHDGHDWVFDDASVGLIREPFVFGMPEMIDRFVKNIPDAHSGFKLYFSPEPFPGYSAKLVLIRREYGGNWYGWPETRMQGWLCPAMFKYFEKTPVEIYCKAEAKPKP